MPRQPRPDLAGVPQHVVQRGNDRQPCFYVADDYCRYLAGLRESATRYGCAVHAYVLMTNHVHLLVTPSSVGAVSRMMQWLGRQYVGYVKKKGVRDNFLLTSSQNQIGDQVHKKGIWGIGVFVLPGRGMKKGWLFSIVWLGFTGFPMIAMCQQVGAPETGARCTSQMTEKDCQQVRMDELFKKMDQAAAAGYRARVVRADALTGQYAAAIQAAVTVNWLVPDGLPNAACTVHIVQLPGGTVVSAVADASCPFDANGRRSVVNAVLRTRTLPYKGFELVFMRNIDFTFFPPVPKNEK